MRELARELWPSDAPPFAILEKVLARADGIPFVLEQIMLSMGPEGAAGIDLAAAERAVRHSRPAEPVVVFAPSFARRP